MASRLTAPSIADTPSRKMPASHHVWPDEAMIASGGYDVQPELAAPPGSDEAGHHQQPGRPGR